MVTNVNFCRKDTVPPLVKIRDVAKLLSVSRHTVYNLIDNGDLLASDVNPSRAKARRHVRVTRTSLLKFYQKRFGHSLKLALANPFEP